MEILQMIAGAFLAIAVVGVGVQLLFAYSIQAVAEKNELSQIAQFLAWVPLLNIYPMVLAGGSSLGELALWIGGSIGASIAFAIVGALTGMGFLGAIGALVAAIGSIFYFGRLMWRIAERRELPGFIGLLMFVPIVNFFVLPYIALHDGMVAPNKAGLALGILLAVGPMFGQYQLLQQLGTMQEETLAAMDEAGVDFVALEAQLAAAEQANLGTGDMATAQDSLAAAQSMEMESMEMESVEMMGKLGGELAALEALDPSDPAQAREIEAGLRKLRIKANAQAATLGPENLAMLETMIGGMSAESVGTPSAELAAAPAALAPGAAATTSDPAAGGSPGCPDGATRQGAAYPRGREMWCESNGVRHGLYTSWYEDGTRAVAGEYRDGQKEGRWKRWYPNGVKRVQADFKQDVEDGLLTAWDINGNRVARELFRAGEAVR